MSTLLLKDAAIVLLLSTIWLGIIRRLEVAVGLLLVQSLILAVIAYGVALLTGIQELYFAALLTILVKGIGVSAILIRVLRTVHRHLETEVVSRTISLVLIFILTIVAFGSVPASLVVHQQIISPDSLPIAVAMFLIGLFLMVTRKKAIMTVIGLITIENGLYLFALSTTYGLPQIVEIGIFFDVGVSIVMLGIFAFHINRLFNTLNVDKLDELRG